MTEIRAKLSDAALAMLVQANLRDDRLATVPANLPPAARNAVCKRLLREGLLEELPAPLNLLGIVWRRDEHEMPIAVRATLTSRMLA